MAFLDARTAYTILHLFGVIIGTGAAYFSDIVFSLAAPKGKISKEQVEILHLGGVIVWVGLAVMFITGMMLYLLNPTAHNESSKFLAKMAIVIVIAINGFVFHVSHIPWLKKNAGKQFSKISDFNSRSSLMLVSGAISIVSWTTAVVLGSLRSLPYSFTVIFGLYLALTLSAIIGALLLKPLIFKRK